MARLTIVSTRPEPPPVRRRSRRVDVAAEDLGLLTACATRYAIGRQSYVTGDVADRVKANWGKLTPRWRIVVIRDLERELDPNAPPLPDRPIWDGLLTWIRQTESARTRRAGERRAKA